jgi:hypothetical protein
MCPYCTQPSTSLNVALCTLCLWWYIVYSYSLCAFSFTFVMVASYGSSGDVDSSVFVTSTCAHTP